MNALRMLKGSEFSTFVERTQLSQEQIELVIDQLHTKGYVDRNKGSFWPNQKGVRYLNNCLMELMA